MIQILELKNFKSIKNKKFNLKNLNLELGLNGMGKSSFIQAILAIRQSNLHSGHLKLNGNYVSIGTTRDALYQYAKKDENLSIGIQFSNSDFHEMEFNYEIDADSFNQTKYADGGYDKFILDNYKNQSIFNNNNFQYLNANRIEPKSIYHKSYGNVVSDHNLGNNGEFTAHFIETHGNSEVIFNNVLHKDTIVKDTTTNTDIINKTLINQINLWMGEISPGVNIRTTSISSDYVLLEYVFKQPNFGNTNRFKPENVGFGITYSLPIVTALLSVKAGQLIIIENPESHVHPRGQAELGKLIAKTAMNEGVQIIVETHSDHILNGIRVAVKEGDISKDKVAIFYYDKIIEASEQYSKITDIEIDKNGTLSEYPENLLDEWSNQLSKLF